MNNETFKVDLEVRDYECDIEGIVNNAVYMNYLEHARHLFLRDIGFDFAELTRIGIHLVVIRIEADYLYPLRSGDRFYVTTGLERIPNCVLVSCKTFPEHQTTNRYSKQKSLVLR